MRRSLAGSLFMVGVGLAMLGFVAGALAASPAAQSTTRAKKGASAPARHGITSFNFDNIPVRSALQVIAEEGSFNLVVSDSVQGNISVRLHDVTWEQALAIVLRMMGLQQRVDGSTRSVALQSP